MRIGTTFNNKTSNFTLLRFAKKALEKSCENIALAIRHEDGIFLILENLSENIGNIRIWHNKSSFKNLTEANQEFLKRKMDFIEND